MRNARKLLLAALAASATLAFAASPVSATGISVSENGVPCSDVVVDDHEVTDGCVSHVTSEGAFELGAQIPFFGYVHQTNCSMEYTLRLDSNGEGTITDLNISTCTSSMTDCAEAQTHGGAGTTSWPVHAEEAAAGELTATMVICIQTGSIRCEGPYVVDVSDTSVGGTLEMQSAPRAPVGSGVCRITGHWIIENQDLEITH